MAQDGQLPVVVLRYISVPKINKEELKFTFFPNPKHDLGIGNRSHPISPGRSQGLGRGLRALWRTENRWESQAEHAGSCCKGPGSGLNAEGLGKDLGVNKIDV